MQQQVKILNPAPGHHGWTSFKKAIKMVKRGLARLEGEAILLIETDYRFNSEAVPRRDLPRKPELPRVHDLLPEYRNWLNSEAAAAWPWCESRGVPLALDGRPA